MILSMLPAFFTQKVGLYGFFVEQAAVVESGLIQRAHRIVRHHAVFGDKRRGSRLGILIKQAVMSDTQADDHIELRLRLVQQLCLHNRITHNRPGYCGTGSFHTNIHFIDGTNLAGNTVYFKTI